MTKADIVNEISKSTGVEKAAVLETVEKFMEVVKDFIVKVRSEKTARNISKNTTIIIPEHKIPAFKPAKVFMEEVK